MRVRIMALLVIAFGLTGGAYADQVVDGRLGPGALYRMVRPTDWNGSLLLYAHGFVPASAPVSLPSDAEVLITLFVPRGFAVAFSSFSENGWAVKDGAQRTQQLLGIFTSKFGSPSRIYIGGGSMGGLIAIKLAEEHPTWFDGMLAACPLSGGVPANVNTATQIALPAAAAMQANPAGAAAIAGVAQTPVPFSGPADLVQSIVTALVGHASTTADLLPQLHGKPYFDNRSVEYTGALPPATLAFINAAVDRFDAAPSALNYMEHYYEPTGDLQIPTMTLSDSLDPVAPGFHRLRYGNLVAAAGLSDHLVQRTVPRYGHCVLTPLEIATAFGDLVAWVELGIKPVP